MAGKSAKSAELTQIKRLAQLGRSIINKALHDNRNHASKGEAPLSKIRTSAKCWHT
jgi:hypothetical protein